MSKIKSGSEIEDLKRLELKLAECLGEAGRLNIPMAASLIGAALEDVGTRVEQGLGVTQDPAEFCARADN